MRSRFAAHRGTFGVRRPFGPLNRVTDMRHAGTRLFDRSGSRQRAPGVSGALAVGALAVGAYAISALAIGRLAIGKARIRRLQIDELSLRNIHGDARGNAVTTTAGVADEYVSFCRRGEFDEAMARFFAADHVRVESLDMIEPPAEIHGVEAIKERSRGFAGETEIHSFDVEGPFVGGSRFAVRFSIDATATPTGRRATTRKLDLYTVHDGAIVRSEIYYNTPPLPPG